MNYMQIFKESYITLGIAYFFSFSLCDLLLNTDSPMYKEGHYSSDSCQNSTRNDSKNSNFSMTLSSITIDCYEFSGASNVIDVSVSY